MKFHLLSDLHMQNHDAPFDLCVPDIGCDYLILAGDIGDPESEDYRNILQKASLLYKHVILIKGNHECHTTMRTVAETDELIQTIANQYDNVSYLNNSSIVIEGYRIIGTTLWSRVKAEHQDEIKKCISDYRKMKDWTVEKNNEEHDKAVDFLTKEIEGAKAISKIIVVTHHAPYIEGTSNPMHAHSTLKSSYATDLSHLMRPPVLAWCYGHTHWSHTQLVNSVILASNQRGLLYEKNMSGFIPHYVLELTR